MFRTVKFRFRELFVSDRNRISHPRGRIRKFFFGKVKSRYGALLIDSERYLSGRKFQFEFEFI